MGKQEVYSVEFFRSKFKNKTLANKVMSASEYQAHIKVNPALKKGDNIKASIVQQLKDSNLSFKSEHKFSDKRKFKFDWAIITTHCKIGIEYEGLMSKKSRHTTITGYSKDSEKYNLAQSEGWIVLRYTAMTYKRMIEDVLKVIDNSVK